MMQRPDQITSSHDLWRATLTPSAHLNLPQPMHNYILIPLEDGQVMQEGRSFKLKAHTPWTPQEKQQEIKLDTEKTRSLALMIIKKKGGETFPSIPIS